MKDDLKKIVIENFESSSGNKLQNLKLSYQFFGKRLGTAPVILINHALTGNSTVSGKDGWWSEIVGINRAVELIQKKTSEQKEVIVGQHPETNLKIFKKKGIKGRSDYLSYNKKNYSIPSELSEKKLTVSDAVKIIDEKKKTKKKN